MKIARILEFRSYGSLLSTLLFVSLAYPVVQNYPGLKVLTGFLFVATLLVALRAVARNKRQVIIAGIITVIAIAGFIGELLGLGGGWRLAYLLGFSTFFFYSSSLMLIDILGRSKHVDADLSFGAISVYVMIGLFFAYAFALLEVLVPGSISGVSELVGTQATTSPVIYFSYVTLTTLGYGDITPVTNIAMSLSYLEAIIGQLFLAILVARLVGLHIAAGTRS